MVLVVNEIDHSLMKNLDSLLLLLLATLVRKIGHPFTCAVVLQHELDRIWSNLLFQAFFGHKLSSCFHFLCETVIDKSK